MDKTCTVCMILLLTVLLAACGRGSNQEAASEKPVDIVSEVAEAVSSETETTAMERFRRITKFFWMELLIRRLFII